MYEYIKGSIEELGPAYVVVEAGGIGYYINISLQSFTELQGLREARVLLHYIIRDDVRTLFGFTTGAERDIFRLLIGVSGVGGNTARMILSTYTPGELVNIISTENAGLLKNVKGLGLKTAQKIIVELRDKITGIGAGGPAAAAAGGAIPGEGCFDEALAALTMLGFGRAASEKILRGLLKDNPGLGVEEAVRLSLKKI